MDVEGKGAIQLEGKFIDLPVVERSRRILDLASLTGQHQIVDFTENHRKGD
jgi:citrate lyase beta subunit